MVAEVTAAGLVAAGRAALVRGAWQSARECFEEALVLEESPAAYEGIGVAARYLWDADGAVSAHEQGYRMARALADQDAAARLAAQLAITAYGLGRLSEANGWTERALTLTEESGPSEGRALALALRAHVAMLARGDPRETLALAERALEVAQEAGSVDVEIVARALEGLALVCMGSVDEGMRRLDAAAAAAVAGEVGDVDLAETICCYLIDACKRVRDLDRAAEWCDRTARIAQHFDDRFMFAVCRVHHADVLIWQGDWDAAAAKLEAAASLFSMLQRSKVADSHVRLAELRRRQGRLDEASELLLGCESHRLYALHTGLLMLDRGDSVGAVEAATRFLRQVDNEDRFERIAGLELLVRASVRCGRHDAAAEAALELRATADLVGTGALRASALMAEGRVAAAGGGHRAAYQRLDDAATEFTRAGAAYEAAQAWLEAAESLRADGDAQRAVSTEARARATLESLGVAKPAGPPGELSRRERQVMVLLTEGRSNQEIAGELVLSVRTVERHLANIYRKLRLSGRSARAAAVAWAYTHGIT